jgi:peptidyl-prolyl cis-trans isomerase C
VRYYTLLFVLVLCSACRHASPQFDPTSSSSIDIDQTPTDAPEIRFEFATPTPTVVPVDEDLVDEETEQEKEVTSRAFEDGLPLAARVNEQPIFLTTYEKQVAQFVRALEAQGVDITSEKGRAALRQTQHQVLEGLVDQLIIEQRADHLGISVTEEEVEAKAQESIVQMQSQAEFEAWLANNNLTYQEFIASLRSQLIANRMFERITSNVPETTEQVRLRYIRVENRATAQAIVEQLKNGVNFTTLVQEQSLDEHSRVNDGDLGWLPRNAGVIPVEVEAIAFVLQPGEVSGPIKTPLGFYVIKLEDKEADRLLTNKMFQALKKQIFTDWLIEQRSSMVIEMYIAL